MATSSAKARRRGLKGKNKIDILSIVGLILGAVGIGCGVPSFFYWHFAYVTVIVGAVSAILSAIRFVANIKKKNKTWKMVSLIGLILALVAIVLSVVAAFIFISKG